MLGIKGRFLLGTGNSGVKNDFWIDWHPYSEMTSGCFFEVFEPPSFNPATHRLTGNFFTPRDLCCAPPHAKDIASFQNNTRTNVALVA